MAIEVVGDEFLRLETWARRGSEMVSFPTMIQVSEIAHVDQIHDTTMLRLKDGTQYRLKETMDEVARLLDHIAQQRRNDWRRPPK